MHHPTDQPARDQTLDALIDEALGACQMLPPYDRCLELDRQLRAAIGELVPAVQAQVGQLTAFSRDWHRLDGILEDTRDVLSDGLGSGLLSAAIQLAALGRQARALTDAVAAH
jgi:hypothetical protein